MNMERWGALAGRQGLFVGGWGGWRCAPARRPRRPVEVLDGDGRPRGGAAVAAPPRGIEPRLLVAHMPPGGPSQQVVHDRRRTGRAPQRRCPSSRACRRGHSPPSMRSARAAWRACRTPAAARSLVVRMRRRRTSWTLEMPWNLQPAGSQPPPARLPDQAHAVRGQSRHRSLTRWGRPTCPTPRRPAISRTLTRPTRPPHRKRCRSRRCSHLRRNLTRPISRVQLADVEGSMPHLR